MFHWFSQLQPSEQFALLAQFVFVVFSAGGYVATIGYLSRRSKEHDRRLDGHDRELKTHGEELAKLEERTGGAHA